MVKSKDSVFISSNVYKCKSFIIVNIRVVRIEGNSLIIDMNSFLIASETPKCIALFLSRLR